MNYPVDFIRHILHILTGAKREGNTRQFSTQMCSIILNISQ